MPRKPNDLTAREVAALKEPGTHRVSANLYLQVTASVAADGDPGSVVRSWLYRYKAGDKRPEMGLGSYPEISLAEARRHVAEHQNQRRDGVDPRAAKAAQQQAAQVERAKATTFEQAAQAYIRSHRAGWKSPKSLAAWEGTLRDYAYPVIGKLPVGAVDTTLVLRVVEPIWNDKPETANRLRGRLEMVLDYARVIGQRSGENPARWRGHLDHLLPARQAVAKTVHHPALPYNELAGFMVELRQQEGVAARALEFAILTVARTGEVLGAPWAEIDLDGRIWTIPGSRRKPAENVACRSASPRWRSSRRWPRSGWALSSFPVSRAIDRCRICRC
jgi:integrase